MRFGRIAVPPNVFFSDLLCHISRRTKHLVITGCRGCHGDNIFSHMMASQGDQEVVLRRRRVVVGGFG